MPKIKITRKVNSAAYSGSLIQQSYGEDIHKGYIMWDLNTNEYKRKLIANDFGFAKIRISQGEIWEERLQSIRFSNDKKKTKVYVEWQDFEENYSLEKENQIIKYIKSHYGCDTVTVDFKELFKDNALNIEDEQTDVIIEKNVDELIRSWIEENDQNHDIEQEFVEELVDLSKKIDSDLEISPIRSYNNVSWYVQTMEVCNIYSYGTKPIVFDFEKLKGLTGVFGQNYSGKTNFIKAMVWGLFQHILGGGESKKIVNIYTDSDKAYVNIYLNIGGVNYRIFRMIRNFQGKDGEIKVEYKVSYQVETIDPETKQKVWVDEVNDKKTNDKKAVKDLIIDSIGTASDFTKVNLQSENGKDNYLNTDQPGKNDVISKYLGLQPYQDRYDYAKKKFNEIVKEQKKLGNSNEVQTEVQNLTDKLTQDRDNYTKLEQEKKEKQEIIDSINNKIINLNALLEKVEVLRESSVSVVNSKIEIKREDFKNRKDQYISVEKWLSENFRKEIPEEIKESKVSLESSLKSKNIELTDCIEKVRVGELWIKENPKKIEGDVSVMENLLSDKKTQLAQLNHRLPSLQGKTCPTCGTCTKEADPEQEKECLKLISEIKVEIENISQKIQVEKDVAKHNINFDKALNKVDGLKNTKTALESEIKELSRKIDVLDKSKDLIDHNKIFDANQVEFKRLRTELETIKKEIDEYKELIVKIEANQEKIKKNKSVEELLETERENIRQEKIFYQNIDRDSTNVFAEIRVSQRSLDALEDKLKEISRQELEYKLYSLYLQAVHKDGIPSQIIKKKLPIINSKIRSILKDLVEYKIDLWLDKKGDIKETFYYNDDKSDSLPMDSSSGAQGFLANLAIRDALHYASRLPKSSLCIIDEGFGKLDSEITINMQQPLQYLKNKYRNVFVVTHKDIIKEFMDHTIFVSKSKADVSVEYQQKYPHAWTTQLDIR